MLLIRSLLTWLVLSVWLLCAHAAKPWEDDASPSPVFESVAAPAGSFNPEQILARANGGDAKAQAAVGALYQAGGGGFTQNHQLAAYWLSQAANQNNAVGQYGLGRAYMEGLGVIKNERQAVVLFIQAVDQGHARAAFELGRLHEEGRGVIKDHCMAAGFYQKAIVHAGSQLPQLAAEAKIRLVALNKCTTRKEEREGDPPQSPPLLQPPTNPPSQLLPVPPPPQTWRPQPHIETRDPPPPEPPIHVILEEDDDHDEPEGPAGYPDRPIEEGVAPGFQSLPAGECSRLEAHVQRNVQVIDLLARLSNYVYLSWQQIIEMGKGIDELRQMIVMVENDPIRSVLQVAYELKKAQDSLAVATEMYEIKRADWESKNQLLRSGQVQLLFEQENPGTGFRAEAYRGRNGELYGVFRGTANTGGVMADLLQGFGDTSLQYEEALRFVERLKSYGNRRTRVLLAGHSLGGGLAQYAALHNGFDAYTFNTAPLNENVQNQALWQGNGGGPQVLNFSSFNPNTVLFKRDPVSTWLTKFKFKRMRASLIGPVLFKKVEFSKPWDQQKANKSSLTWAIKGSVGDFSVSLKAGLGAAVLGTMYSDRAPAGTKISAARYGALVGDTSVRILKMKRFSIKRYALWRLGTLAASRAIYELRELHSIRNLRMSLNRPLETSTSYEAMPCMQYVGQ